MLEYAFIAAMLGILSVGIFCAARLDGGVNWAMRLAFLSPSIVALYTLSELLSGRYTACWPDFIQAISLFAIYYLAAYPPIIYNGCGQRAHILSEKHRKT